MAERAARVVPRSRRWRWILGLVIAAVVYVGLLLAYGLGNANVVDSAEPTVPPGGIAVVFVVEDINSASDGMTVKIVALPDDTLVDEEGVPKEPITLFVAPVITGAAELNWGTDRRIYEADAVLTLDGDIQNWPFDRYVTNAAAQAYTGEAGDLRDVPTTVTVQGSAQGWRIGVAPSALARDGVGVVDVSLHRTVAIVCFGLLLVLVMVALAALALFVAISCVRGRRRLEPNFLAWIGAMLFATVPLRNFMPGSPPAGSWVDIAVVLWVIVALGVALVLGVTAWWRAGRPLAEPVDATNASVPNAVGTPPAPLAPAPSNEAGGC